MTDPQRLADATLLTCPFCGVVPYTDRDDSYRTGRWTVQCLNDDCPCETHTTLRETESDAIAAWNTRSSTTALEIGRAMGREDCISALNELYEKTKREKPGPTGDAETDMALDCAMTAIEEYSIDLRKRFGPLTGRQQETP